MVRPLLQIVILKTKAKNTVKGEIEECRNSKRRRVIRLSPFIPLYIDTSHLAFPKQN